MIECLGALAILAGQGQVCSGPFNADRDGEAVRACQLAYSRLEYSAARLIDRQARTRLVLQGFRGGRRMAPLVEKVASENPDVMAEGEAGSGLAAMFMLTVGNAQIEQPEQDPNVVQATILSQIAERCDAQLTAWGVPTSDEMPDEVERNGYADFRVNGHSVGETFRDHVTASLARAACDGGPNEVARAVAAGGLLNETGLRGMTPLAWAITCENLAGIKALLEGGANPNQTLGELGSPVALAAGYRNSGILQLLLQHGGNPNADDGRESALAIAYTIGRYGAGWTNFDLLMTANADINHAGPLGDTVMDKALLFADYERVLGFLEKGYRGDLVEVGLSLTMDEKTRRGSDGPWQAKVKTWLKDHGVKFPVRYRPRRNVQE